MSYRLNPLVVAAIEPPIAEAQEWLAGLPPRPDRPLLDLAQAVPGSPPPRTLTEHLAGLVGRPETSRYTEIAGLPSLRKALANHLSERYGGTITAEQVFITAGCNQAFCLALMALAGAGDEVLLPLPYYFNHQMWLEMLGVKTVHLSFRPDRGGLPDPEEAAARIGERTRAIVLVSPNNPTGAVYPQPLLEAFFELARSRGCALILDETYKDFLEPPGPAHGLLARPDWRGTFVQLYSFSKVFALTGYRVGSIVAGPALLAAVGKIMDSVAICAPRIGQEAALYGLSRLDAWVAQNRDVMARRAAVLRALFEDRALGYRLISAGAYFAYVRHPFAGVPARQVARHLAREHRLLCLPGSMFGPGQEAYLRIAYANLEADLMPEIALRLKASQADGPPAPAITRPA